MRRKALAINLFANILAFIITFGINFFLTPYIVGAIGAEGYGFVSLINNLVSYLSLATIALNSMASRFVSIHIFQKDLESANRYFSSIFISNLILSASICILSLPVILKLEHILNISDTLVKDVKLLTVFVLISFIINLMTTIFNIAVFVRDKLYLNSLRNVEVAIFKAVILVCLFRLFQPKIYFVGAGVAISALYGVVWNIHYTKKLLPEMKISKRYFDLKVVKELILSGIWNVVNKSSEILNNGLDLLICNLLINPVGMGILAISKTIPNIMYMIVGSLSSTFAPRFTENYAKGNNDDLVSSLNESIKVLGFFMSILVGVFIALGDVFFRLWVPSQNPSELQILSVLSIAPLIIIASTAGIYEIFMITNKLKTNSLVALGIGILNVLTVLMLLKTTGLGIYAIAGVSSTTAILKDLMFTLPYAARCINQKWYIFYKAALTNVMSIFLIVIMSYRLKSIIAVNNWINFIFLAGICVLLAMALNLFVILRKNDRQVLKKILVSKFNR